MFIPPDKAAYYDALTFFGPDITTTFSKCTFDIEEAGKCFAAGRRTASAFHLMRIMEYAVRRIARKLRVGVNPNATWGQILHQLDAAINCLPDKTERQRTRILAYQGLKATLHAVKEAWRNPTMHPQAT
jgi:hypothetical protein